MSNLLDYVYLVPLAPLATAVLIFFFGQWLPTRGAALGILAMGAACAYSWTLFVKAALGGLKLPYEWSVEWFRFGMYSMDLGVYVDGLTLSMLIVVTTVSFLVQVYSTAYMHDDPRFKRFFAYLSMFTFAMLALVVANSVFTLFMSWELVGLCSYLLISFWFEKPEAAYAGKKAFITTKVGDLGLFIGIMLLFASAGTLKISALQTYVASGYLPVGVATAVAIGLFIGAAGKSGQFPLFVWLPDAMEGPTPVSALIHAATMVAAGVFLVARVFFIYAISPVAMEVVAWTGLATAFLAATMAFASYDFKRILAFSTISQLGFMMVGLGVGDMTAGMFHLTTHAFFKALLFLSAGSVIHAVHTGDIRLMGGLKAKMPITFAVFMIATLAIAGIPPFAGYFSKDAILASVYGHNKVMYVLLSLAAAMTTFYMFRLGFLTFFGHARDHHKFDHAHESPAAMTVPLLVLAVLSLVSGFALEWHHTFKNLVSFPVPGMGEHHVSHLQIGGTSVALSLVAIGLSYLFFLGNPKLADAAKERLSLLYKVLEARYGLDALYLKIVDLGDAVARAFFWFDYNVIDQFFVDGFGAVARFFSWLGRLFDDYFIDGAMVNGTGYVTRGFGAGLRAAQTGLVQNYLLYVALAAGLFAVLVWLR